MIRFNTLASVAIVVFACSTFAMAQASARVDYEGNLAKIPAKDPAPKSVPAMVEAMKGKHPRLLFTATEAEALKQAAANDPVLKKAYTDVSAWSKRYTLDPKTFKAVVENDTAALTTSVNHAMALAYGYALDKGPNTKKAIIDILQFMLDQPYWADTAELDSNMGAGNNMLLVGTLYDVVHDELEPELRAKLSQKILTHVRRMHYLGFKQLSLMPIKYWQQDPQNNHRWHRNAGMAACLLSIADDDSVETGYLLEQLKQEMDFILKWFPADGDCHEGATYQQFGFMYLALGATMMDRVLGTKYLEHPGFRNVWAQQLYYTAPGRNSNMSFGDDMNSETVFNHLDAAFFLAPKLSRDKNVQAAMKRRMEIKAQRKDNRPATYPWSVLTFYDPTVGEGDYKAITTHRLFADLGALSMRDSWEPNAVAFTFKCGPYGGYRLNEYAHEHKDEKTGKAHYVNVAHDDPDANTFALAMDGAFIFHPGLYSFRKITETQNGVTVNEQGQIGEGTDYMQPVPDKDMRTLSYLTGFKAPADGKGSVIVEGEASKAYRMPLERFRRTAVYMPGEYILLLDDIRAGAEHKVAWRGTVEKGNFDKPETGHAHVETRAGKRLDFQILANRDFTGALDHMFLDGRFGGALMQQFQFGVTGPVKFACLMDPWQKKPEMTLAERGDVVTLTIKTAAGEDIWSWTSAKDNHTPSDLKCTRNGKTVAELREKDKAPHGD